jgi:hypothetical protein
MRAACRSLQRGSSAGKKTPERFSAHQRCVGQARRDDAWGLDTDRARLRGRECTLPIPELPCPREDRAVGGREQTTRSQPDPFGLRLRCRPEEIRWIRARDSDPRDEDNPQQSETSSTSGPRAGHAARVGADMDPVQVPRGIKGHPAPERRPCLSPRALARWPLGGSSDGR